MRSDRGTYKVKEKNIVKLNKYYKTLVGGESENDNQKKDVVNKNNK